MNIIGVEMGVNTLVRVLVHTLMLYQQLVVVDSDLMLHEMMIIL